MLLMLVWTWVACILGLKLVKFISLKKGRKMSKRIFLKAFVVLIFLPFGFLMAAETNVYVRLYDQRVQFAKADVRRQEAETTFQIQRLERARILVEKKVITREEFQRNEA